LAGFEIRDVIEWLYFSGFPKSMDVGKAFDKRAKKLGVQSQGFSVAGDDGRKAELKQNLKYRSDYGYVYEPKSELARKWNGWGTALKPAHEPIIMARKPLDGTVADNVERWGTGALNIDGCRIPVDSAEKDYFKVNPEPTEAEDRKVYGFTTYDKLYKRGGGNEKGRFPANCVTTEPDAFFSKYFNITPPELSKKASRKDRNSDWKGSEIKVEGKLPKHVFGDGFNSATKVIKDGDEEAIRNGELPEGRTLLKNNHPTVKPTDLMAWLCRLVTPPGGIVLDPFAGSGSTLVAAKREGFQYIGIEREAEYVEIAKARVG